MVVLRILGGFGGLVVDYSWWLVRNKRMVGGFGVKAVRLDRGVEWEGDGEDVVVGNQLHLVVAVVRLQVSRLDTGRVR